MNFRPPPFRPRFPWWGGDLQTLANVVRPPRIDLAPHRNERLSFALMDGTGDVLQASLARSAIARSGRPLVILIHGLTGAEDSLYLLTQSRLLLDRGFTVLRLNLRGAGPSRATCAGQYYAGRSQDFRAFLGLLPADLTKDGIAAVGYSLGGAMLLKYLGEEGAATPLIAAASVSAPIDLSATSRSMLRRRNTIYHRHLLGEMKREATAGAAVLSAPERSAILGSKTIWEYDELFIAPRHGFDGAEDYYDKCKPVRFMPGIRVPTLVVASLDDPWIPGELYKGYDWSGNGRLTPLLTEAGGHVGFHGRDSRQPWSDQVVADFLS